VSTVHPQPSGWVPPLYKTSWDDVEEEEVRWLAPGLLAEGKITVLDGNPGIGKTTVWVDWAARITDGRALPGGKPLDPAAVFIFNGEDTVADTLKPRARLHGANMKKMHSLSVHPNGTPVLVPNDLPLIKLLIETHGVKLLIFDPIYSFMNADMTKSQQVRQALTQLQDVIESTRCACLFLRHFNKNSQSSEAMYRGEGSIAIAAVARVLLAAGEHPADPNLRVIANTKSNVGKGINAFTYRIDEVPGEQHGRLSWEGTANLSANDLLAPSNRHEREEREDLWIWAEAQLPVTVKEMEKRCRQSGLSFPSVKEVLKQHNVAAKPKGQSGEWEYRKRPTLEEVGVLECAGCGGVRFKNQNECPSCGAKPVILRRNQ
jgi:hypothetical protein